MRKNPLAETLGRLLGGPAADPRTLEVDLVHRGAPGGRRTVLGGEVEGVSARAIRLEGGSEIPLHRVLELRLGDRVVWKGRARAGSQTG